MINRFNSRFISSAVLVLLSACHSKNNTENTYRLLPLHYPKDSSVKVWEVNDKYIFYTSEMSIDADGSPRAYSPQNTGIDDTAYAFKNGKLAEDIVVYDGARPYVQNASDPYPGNYLSQTTLQDVTRFKTNYKRYVNSDSIPYISIPADLEKYVIVGDIVLVYNAHTKRRSYAIIGDSGENTHIGEGSIKLAQNLGILLTFKPHVDCSQCGSGITYVIRKHSTRMRPLNVSEIDSLGKEIFLGDILEKLKPSAF